MAEPARAELRPYEPTWADSLARLLLGDGRVSPERRRFVEGILGTSGLGDTDALSLRTLLVPETAADVALMAAGPAGKLAGKAVGKGVAAAGGALLALEPGEAEAGLSGAGRKGGRNIVQRVTDAVNADKSASYVSGAGDNLLASRSANLYNPTPRPQRAFGEDYPNGAGTDAARNLRYTIDGDTIRARFVVGRRVAEGADEALSPAEFKSLAEAITGRSPMDVGKHEIGGDAGRLILDRRSRRPAQILYDKGLSEAQRDMVIAHENGHAIQAFSGKGPIAAGHVDDARTVYNELNNPQSYGKLWGPEQNGYRKPADVSAELSAEAIRAYMTDPNYFKSVAPSLAKKIRETFNSHPELSKIIQFNSLAGLLGLGALGASQNGKAAPIEQLLDVK